MTLSKMDIATRDKAKEALAELLEEYWPEVNDILRESPDGVMLISCGLKVDVRDKLPQVTAKLAFSKKWADEVSLYVEDPDQQQLFDKDEG